VGPRIPAAWSLASGSQILHAEKRPGVRSRRFSFPSPPFGRDRANTERFARRTGTDRPLTEIFRKRFLSELTTPHARWDPAYNSFAVLNGQGDVLSDCLNLMELFGGRFVVRFDPAYDAWHRPADCLDPWMMTLKSRFGIIFPHGRHVLAVEAERPSIRKQLDSMDCCRRYLDGERFGCWLFHLRDFERVAQVMRPARKRGWTGEDRRQAADRLKANLRRPGERRELSRFSVAVSTMTGHRD
jgi:hypothetical protein